VVVGDDLEKAREELAQAQVPEGFTVTVPVYAGDLFDEEATVLIKESLAKLGITLAIQKMPIGQKRTLMTKKQVDMAVYDWRPWVPDAGYFIYWNWLPDSFINYWNYLNPEAQVLGNESITMAIGSPERQAKLRRFQEIVNGDIGLVPLFTQFDNLVMREHVQGYVYYPDAVPVLAKLSLGEEPRHRERLTAFGGVYGADQLYCTARGAYHSDVTRCQSGHVCADHTHPR
jgi:peptide/nickel transport system substrate-binding protein